MSEIAIAGWGAVSPAGWGVESLMDALDRGEPLGAREIARPGWELPLRVRAVPAPVIRPAWSSHPRLRRVSPITQYTVAAALEALGDDVPKVSRGELRLGLVFCVMSGCVNYSRRFYDEVLRDPATASPLVFPETVFNAPASHLAALLGTTAINYTLVGDPGAFLIGVSVAADWLLAGRVDACVVVGAEETDWAIADAFRLFSHELVLSEGAAAILLKRTSSNEQGLRLHSVTSAHPFHSRAQRTMAARAVRQELQEFGQGACLVDGRQGVPRFDEAESDAWHGWHQRVVSPKRVLGEGLMAGGAWQAAVACELSARRETDRAVVSVVGCNEHAVGAVFAT